MNSDTAQTELVDYLHRLGCTVERLDDRRLDVCVEYPETVQDEHLALVEWCGSWAAARTSGLHVVAA